MTTKPNLFIIGAAKCGTTSLHNHLARHPDIFMSEPKEPGFFTPAVGYYPTDRDWYAGLFENAGDARYRGESSTHYTKHPVLRGAADRIAAYVDERPRFLYLMRDPVERAISHYWHDVRKHSEHRPLRQAIRDNPEYLAVSHYAMQLDPYFQRFGPESVFATTFEALVERSEETVGAVLDWLELPPLSEKRRFRKDNARPEVFTRVRGRALVHRFVHSALWDRLSPVTPDWMKEVGRRAGYAPADAEDPETEAVIEEIRPELLRRTRELERLLKRSFPEWTTTLGSTAGAMGRNR